MLLPSRLGSSTLGDVLGKLHRARVTGIVELYETSSIGSPGRRHTIALFDGLVADVDTVLSSGELLDKLESLFALSDASIRFHVARRSGSGRALVPREFLHGRLRARDRRSGRVAPKPVASSPEESAARALLGVSSAAREDDVRRAFRKLAREHHPDRIFGASEGELDRAKSRLAALSAAYHSLLDSKATSGGAQ